MQVVQFLLFIVYKENNLFEEPLYICSQQL